MRSTLFFLATFLLILLHTVGCKDGNNPGKVGTNSKGQPVYDDVPYLQEVSVRYYLNKDHQALKLRGISANRDGQIRMLADSGLFVPDNGSMFYSGKLVRDVSYPQTNLKKIKAIGTYQHQTVFLDSKQLFSNAWAGKLQIDHELPDACLFAGGKDFHFLISDGENLIYMDRDSKKIWSGNLKGTRQIRYRESNNSFLLVTENSVSEFTPDQSAVNELYQGNRITCAASVSKNNDVVIGTKEGYLMLSDKKMISKLPCEVITNVNEINGCLWFGTTWGTFYLNEKEKYSYFAGERWLPGNHVISIEEGPENSVLVLTENGLGQLSFNKMTLEEKALFYEKQVREKNIRYGMNNSVVNLMESYSSGQTGNQPSDNLWTGMYLASQLFRYKVTGSQDALQNAREAFEAMERLHQVTGIKGLFARTFERDYKVENTKVTGWKEKELQTGSPATLWLPCKDHPNWTFRSTASSDQTVAQIFAMTVILELSDDEDMKQRALTILDNLMSYIVDNDLYIIDVDGEPTMWGKWNPDYVNRFPKSVGDRKINSSNIIAFLQTAYKFTGKEKFKTKAYELMDKYGYLENLMRPMEEIGKVTDTDDLWAKTLSAEWNHSDDEMYFLAYWGLHPYAFTPELKEKFSEAIKDHWNIERPEKNALWNFIYAMTGAKEFDLNESVEFLKNYPMDLRNWSVQNSHRKDIELIPENFRGQTTKELLPLGEMPLFRHNGDIFRLDSAGDGKSLISAGDTWLLPYWMGRYLGVITAPIKRNK